MNGPSRRLRVVKLGGSLLELPDLPVRLRRWLALQPAATNVLVVGGGRAADAVREVDRQDQLTDDEAHWHAIDAMRSNARLLAESFPEAIWLERIEDVPTYTVPLLLLDPLIFMRRADPQHPCGPLPASWDVTSDSIAARAADMLGARELVLLKSTLPAGRRPQDRLFGYVDEFFWQASRGLSHVRCVNLRDESFSEMGW
ncbi:MAG TPA: hypothetical protein VHC22_26065 [Pirellulales bacterium]|nr:hypothetical protein [Pirellulales bacterium]